MSIDLAKLSVFSGSDAGTSSIEICLYGPWSDKSPINRLRYRAYRDAGWIPEDSEQEFTDAYDNVASTVSIGAFRDRECIGTLRLVFGGARERTSSLPFESEFPKLLAELNNQNHHSMVEFSRLAVEPTLENESVRAILYAALVRAAVTVAAAAEAETAVIAVHRSVSKFYQRVCGFHKIGESARYSEIQEPTELLALRLNAISLQRRRTQALVEVSAAEIYAARRSLRALRHDKAA